MPCRINKRRIWTTRLFLESLVHRSSIFFTLTYRDECLPEGGNLNPRDMTLFLKRLRKAVAPLRIRFFIVGSMVIAAVVLIITVLFLV